MSKKIVLGILALSILPLGWAWAQPPSEGEELATVNGRPITVGGFRTFLKNLPPNLAFIATTPEGKREFLNTLINRELLIDEAMTKGLDKDKELVERLKTIKEELLISAIIEKEITSKVKVEEEEVKGYYDDHPELFSQEEQVRVRHILVASEEEAKKVEERLKAGEDFTKVAQEVSLDKSSPGGDLGFISKGATVPEFEQAAFALKNSGDMSPLVKTPFGYHIIRLEERKAASVKPFEEVKEQLEEQLGRQKRRETFGKFLEGLRGKATITIHETVLKRELGEEKK